jgi:threonine dehydratase
MQNHPSTALDLDSVRTNRVMLGESIRDTPMVACPLEAEADLPTRLWLKLEAMQVTGSFKVRGALTVIRHLSPEQRARGLVTVSSGNHAIATAFGARQYGCSACIYMSASADAHRVARAREFGADVRLTADVSAAFEEVNRVVREEGKVFVHPFEGPYTTLGNASISLELDAQLPADVDTFAVAIGGGGLASGLAPIIKALRPKARVIGVEPEGAPTLTRSIALGAPAELSEMATIADSLAPPFTGPNTFALVRDYVDEIVLVSDEQIRRSMRLLLEQMKLFIEPSGAAALAAVLAYPHRFAHRHVCAVVCGSNIGLARYRRVLGDDDLK